MSATSTTMSATSATISATSTTMSATSVTTTEELDEYEDPESQERRLLELLVERGLCSPTIDPRNVADVPCVVFDESDTSPTVSNPDDLRELETKLRDQLAERGYCSPTHDPSDVGSIRFICMKDGK